MSELRQVPPDWRMVPVGAVCNLGRGRVISQIEIDEHPGEYPVYSSQSKNEGVFGHLDTFDFEGEYVTWTTDGAYAGTVFYRSGKFNCTNVCGTLEAKSDDLNMKYLAYALSVRTRKHVSYVGNPKLMNNVMAEILVPFPPPSEQRRIAEILDAADEATRQTGRVIAKLKAVKAGLLHDLLTRGLDEHGQLRDLQAHPERFKDSPLGRIPREWAVVQVGDICTLGRGRVISQIDLAEHPGLYPVYSSQSKDEGIFGYLDTFDFEGEYVTWTTDGAYAGTVFYRSGRFNCTNVCGTLRPKSEALSMRYLALVLSTRTNRYVSYIGNPKLMNNVMAKIPLPLPSHNEQKAIARCLDAHDARIRAEAAGLAKLRQVKRGLMDDLLTGRVRVT